MVEFEMIKNLVANYLNNYSHLIMLIILGFIFAFIMICHLISEVSDKVTSVKFQLDSIDCDVDHIKRGDIVTINNRKQANNIVLCILNEYERKIDNLNKDLQKCTDLEELHQLEQKITELKKSFNEFQKMLEK